MENASLITLTDKGTHLVIFQSAEGISTKNVEIRNEFSAENSLNRVISPVGLLHEISNKDHLDTFSKTSDVNKSLSCLSELNEHLSSQNNGESMLVDKLLADISKENNMKEEPNSKILYLCSQCSSVCSSLESCKQHMLKEHKLQTDDSLSNADTNCDGKTQSSKSDQNHITSNKDTNERCSVPGCSFKSRNIESVNKHRECHKSKGIFSCPECDTNMETWVLCATHLWKTHSIDAGLISCPHCTYKTMVSLRLRNHILIHSDNKKFECNVCKKCFKQRAQLINHLWCHKNRNDPDTPSWYTSKRCDICHKSYANAKCLKKHIQAVHRKLKPFACQFCDHTSACKAMLKIHLRQHTGEKPYKCQYCDFKTGDHNSLRRHTMRHNNIRPYHCSFCPYTSIQSAALKCHISSKHSKLQRENVNQGSRNAKIENKNQKDVEVFPGNMAAAQLICRCLDALSPGSNVSQRADLTSSMTSADGNFQTITIEVPPPDIIEKFFLVEKEDGKG